MLQYSVLVGMYMYRKRYSLVHRLQNISASNIAASVVLCWHNLVEAKYAICYKQKWRNVLQCNAAAFRWPTWMNMCWERAIIHYYTIHINIGDMLQLYKT